MASSGQKLHLGCGQNYLKGYVNIDFPSSEHTVQDKPVADEFHDILKLRYDAGSIDEVRLHHVFEHFTRPVAVALLASWRSWLKPGGIIHIETPDFERTALEIIKPLASEHAKAVGLRHLFGSNEADWATHYEGWSVKRLDSVLKLLDFKVTNTKRNAYKGMHNAVVIAKRGQADLDQNTAEIRARDYLKAFSVDDSPSETALLDVWMQAYRDQANRTWAK